MKDRKFQIYLVLVGLLILVLFVVNPVLASRPALPGAAPTGAGLLQQEEPPTLKDMFIGGVNVMVLIIILVQIAKTWFGVQGNTLRYISLGLGILFAVLWQSTQGFPSDVAGWVVLVVRLLYGVLASGIVDFSRDLASRAGTKAMGDFIKRMQTDRPGG
jgi:hypothetical protein